MKKEESALDSSSTYLISGINGLPWNLWQDTESLQRIFIAPHPITRYAGPRSAVGVTCLTVDTCLTADSGVASLIPAGSHIFVEIDHEIISTVILLPSVDSRRAVGSYKGKYVHKVLVNCLVKLAQEKKCG